MNEFLADLDPNIVLPSVIAAYAAIKSAQAAKQTKSTGNGFARDVRQSLQRIEERIDLHLQNHK